MANVTTKKITVDPSTEEGAWQIAENVALVFPGKTVWIEEKPFVGAMRSTYWVVRSNVFDPKAKPPRGAKIYVPQNELKVA